MKLGLSAVVLTKNEESRIERCLDSVSFCDQIIVIDDFSWDKTREIAKKKGALVYTHALRSDFGQQRNFGLKKARGNWVLFLDADEEINSALRNEIIKLLRQKSNSRRVFVFKRRDKFLGKWLRFGETASVRLVRLAKKGNGQWQRPVHEVWQAKGRKIILKNPILHNREISITSFLEKINDYSSFRARELYQQRVKTNIFLIFAYPSAKFIQNYIFRLGFLDGCSGFIMAGIMALHSFLARAKLYFLWQKND